MEKRSLIIVLIIVLFLPQKVTKAEGPDIHKTVTKTLLDYALVKSDVLSYEISKKVKNLENKIDSLKNNIK